MSSSKNSNESGIGDQSHDRDVTLPSVEHSMAHDPSRDTESAFNQLTTIEPAIGVLRRQRLRVASKILLLFGLCCLLYVFASSFLTSRPNERSYETMRVPLAQQSAGSMELYNWNGRPILVLHRTQAQIDSLLLHESELQDADSRRSRQPEFALNRQRSREARWFVAIAAGTDLSCAIEYLPPQSEEFRSQPWPGGMADACRGARYDTAGRVYADQHARKNLTIPQYTIDGDELVLGGR